MTDILELFSLAPKEVPLENGKSAHLRRLSAADRLAWMQYVAGSGEEKIELAQAYNVQAQLLALTLCDKDGKRVFGDDDDSRAKIRSIDELTFNRLAALAFEINGMGKKGSEDVKKKSESTPSSTDSSASSPRTSKRR